MNDRSNPQVSDLSQGGLNMQDGQVDCNRYIGAISFFPAPNDTEDSNIAIKPFKHVKASEREREREGE